MVGIHDSFNHIYVAIPDISEPDGQEEGPLPLCLRWLERCVCAARHHTDGLLVQCSAVPS